MMAAVEVFSAELENVSLHYHDSFARLTVNAQGQVIAASSGYDMEIIVRGARLGVGAVSIGTDMSVAMDVQRHFADFHWG